jgi:tRNA modification GTPase
VEWYRPGPGRFFIAKKNFKEAYSMISNDTIAAISTPLGEGGIGIVKISGSDSFKIARQIFKTSNSKELKSPKPRHLYHGHIVDARGTIIDEVLISFMPAPYTYTRENIVEINCHSGILTLRAILKLTLDSGARLAEPGEFTKRAFLNGRIDLAQAEAVMNIIRARSEQAVTTAAKVLKGDLHLTIENLKNKIIALRAPVEAMLDYPEEYDELNRPIYALDDGIKSIRDDLRELLKGTDISRAFQEGVSVAIVGKPNVGKSSLLNALLRQQKAIVHDMPGTTRDLLEGYMSIGGYPLRLVDTAGIQGTKDPVEKEGIERTKIAAAEAQLLIMVMDGSAKISDAECEMADLVNTEHGLVVVINKADLSQELDENVVEKLFPNATIVHTSALTGEGICQLEEGVARQLDSKFGSFPESPVIVNIRHEYIISDALRILESVIEMLDVMPVELISEELQMAWHKLGEISGDAVNDELLDKIFSEFCLGK